MISIKIHVVHLRMVSCSGRWAPTIGTVPCWKTRNMEKSFHQSRPIRTSFQRSWRTTEPIWVKTCIIVLLFFYLYVRTSWVWGQISLIVTAVCPAPVGPLNLFVSWFSGYSVGSLISSRGAQLYVAGAPRFNHTGKVIIFTLKNTGNLTILQALLGEQVTHTHTSMQIFYCCMYPHMAVSKWFSNCEAVVPESLSLVKLKAVTELWNSPETQSCVHLNVGLWFRV